MSGLVGVFLTVEAVHHLDDEEDSEGNNEEIDDILDKVAVSDVGGRVGTEEVGNVDGESRKVETAGEKTSDRHDDVVDERFDDGGEGATDGDTDGEINDAAAVDEFFEFTDEAAVSDFLDGMK